MIFEFFARARYAEVLQFEHFVVLAFFLGIDWQHLDEDVHVADIDEHLWPEDSTPGVHLLKDSEADLEVPYHVLFGLNVKPNCEVTSVVLFTLSLVSERNHEIVNDDLLFAVLVLHHGLPVVGVLLHPGGRGAEERVTVEAGSRALFLAFRLDCAEQSLRIDL